MKKLLLTLLLPALALLAACGAKIDGTYADEMGVTSFTFKSGKVVMSAMGMSEEADYKVEDNKIKIKTPKGEVEMNILADGSLPGPLNMKLVKRADK